MAAFLISDRTEETHRVLPLLRSVESISSCRDRVRLPFVLLDAVATLLGDGVQAGIFERDALGATNLRFGCSRGAVMAPTEAWADLLKVAGRQVQRLPEMIGGLHCAMLELESSELRREQLVLVFGLDHPWSEADAEAVETLAHIYGSQIRLLDYAELDSLTRLLNRKTFEETFDRLLSASADRPCRDALCERRGGGEDDGPAWLCVVDIDHFKRINDSFGHLFGDEVLLRMGDLMRKTFRDGDRLFRFGGEEFVVILNAPDEAGAAAGFERFRESVESHEFPQVGKVTCSIGFTAISSTDVPTDVVGRADEALYFAKENGRNQVCCYERLVSEGLVAKAEPAEAKIAEDIDLDALFG